MEVRVSVNGSLVVSVPADGTEVLACVWKHNMCVSEQNYRVCLKFSGGHVVVTVSQTHHTYTPTSEPE